MSSHSLPIPSQTAESGFLIYLICFHQKAFDFLKDKNKKIFKLVSKLVLMKMLMLTGLRERILKKNSAKTGCELLRNKKKIG